MTTGGSKNVFEIVDRQYLKALEKESQKVAKLEAFIKDNKTVQLTVVESKGDFRCTVVDKIISLTGLPEELEKQFNRYVGSYENPFYFTKTIKKLEEEKVVLEKKVESLRGKLKEQSVINKLHQWIRE